MTRDTPITEDARTLVRHGWLVQVGPLRVGQALFVVVLLPLVFLAGKGYHGWAAIPSYVAPVLVIILVWLLLLDLLMSRLFMGEKQGAERTRYRRVLTLDAALLAALVLFWGPWFVSLLSG